MTVALQERLPMFLMGQTTPELPLPLGDLDPSNTWFLGPTRVSLSNAISIGSAVFAGLTNVTNKHTDRPTDTQTDRPRYSVCSNRSLSPAVAAMRLYSSNVYLQAVAFLKLQSSAGVRCLLICCHILSLSPVSARSTAFTFKI